MPIGCLKLDCNAFTDRDWTFCRSGRGRACVGRMRLCRIVAGVADFWRSIHAPARPGELALTFDDGPNPVWTPRLLEILEATT